MADLQAITHISTTTDLTVHFYRLRRSVFRIFTITVSLNRSYRNRRPREHPFRTDKADTTSTSSVPAATPTTMKPVVSAFNAWTWYADPERDAKEDDAT